MRKPRQRVVDPLRLEGRERKQFAGRGLVKPVDDLVVCGGEVGRVEQVAQRHVELFGHRRLDISAFAEGEMQRDRGFGFGHRQRPAVVAQQEFELGGQVVPEQRWPGDRRGVAARRDDVAIGEAGIDHSEGGRFHADLRIEGAIAACRFLRGKALKGLAQKAGVAFIKGFERGNRAGRVGKFLRFDRFG